jgi:hypothetical protein
VAGYFAWKSFRTKEDEAQDPPQSNSNTEDAAFHKLGLLKKVCMGKIPFIHFGQSSLIITYQPQV